MENLIQRRKEMRLKRRVPPRAPEPLVKVGLEQGNGGICPELEVLSWWEAREEQTLMATPETSHPPYVVTEVVPGRAQIVLRLEFEIRLGVPLMRP